MKFSFILPAWKGIYLKESISSILAQSYKDFELIVVDDCSPDDIHGIVKSFDDRRISYHRNEKNIGGKDLVAQWNRCLKYATGEYVILATDDDVYEPEFLSSFVNLIEKYPNVGLFRARILQIDSKGRILKIDRCYKEYLSQEEFIYHVLHGIKGGIPQYIFSRKMLFDYGGFVDFPLAWSSDDSTAIMMATKGMVNCQEHLVKFRWSGLNISSSKDNIFQKVQARLQMYHWLLENVPEIKITNDYTRFLHNEVNEYLPIYNKIILIRHIKPATLVKKLKCLKLVFADKNIIRRDKWSIAIRSFL